MQWTTAAQLTTIFEREDDSRSQATNMRGAMSFSGFCRLRETKQLEGNIRNHGNLDLANHTHPEEVVTHAPDHIDIQNVTRKFVFVNNEKLSK